MSYFEHIKQPGETVAYDKPLHWIVYVRAALISAVIIAVSMPLMRRDTTFLFPAAILIILVAIFLHATFKRYSTEIIVTDRRVIFKTGIFMRNTLEMNMAKIESVDVNQTVIGRIFNYGTVIIRGTGSSYEPLAGVDAPLELRNSIIAR